MSKRRPAVSSHHHLLSFSRKHPRRSICARLKVLFRSSEVLLSFSQPAHFQSFCNPARAHSSPDPAHGKMKNLWRDFFFLVQVQKSLSKVDVETFQEAWSGIWTEPVQGKGKAKAAGGRGSLPERLPSQHWMEDINHALLSVNRRLRDFALESQGEGVLTRPPLQCPRTLVLCTDQESKQLASAYYTCNSTRTPSFFTFLIQDIEDGMTHGWHWRKQAWAKMPWGTWHCTTSSTGRGPKVDSSKKCRMQQNSCLKSSNRMIHCYSSSILKFWLTLADALTRMMRPRARSFLAPCQVCQ